MSWAGDRGARVLVAFDKFRGSLTAREAGDSLARGIRRASRGRVVVRTQPVSDGGEGTIEILADAGFDIVHAPTSGPDLALRTARYATRSNGAVVEAAEACRADEHRPPVDQMTASSFGVGQVMAQASDKSSQLALALGGSSTTDGGLGMIQALGAKIRFDNDSTPGGLTLAHVESIDVTPVQAWAEQVEITLAADVEAPLLGPSGAALQYSPQKGATPTQAAALEAAMERWAAVVIAATGHDFVSRAGAGAAGGIGFAAMSVLGARPVSGSSFVLDAIGIEEMIGWADVVVTGEGRIDAQTLMGKIPSAVAKRARLAGKPVVGVCGVSLLDAAEERHAGFQRLYELQRLAGSPRDSMANAATLMAKIGEQLVGEPLLGDG